MTANSRRDLRGTRSSAAHVDSPSTAARPAVAPGKEVATEPGAVHTRHWELVAKVLAVGAGVIGTVYGRTWRPRGTPSRS
jgi:hypothetical protein